MEGMQNVVKSVPEHVQRRMELAALADGDGTLLPYAIVNSKDRLMKSTGL